MASGRHTQPPPHRRTSSIAYDNGSKEKYSRIDLWRKRLNLPPNFVDTTPTALSSSSSSSSHTQQDQDDEIKPIYTFGVLTDIQYAPIPDGHSYSGNPRYYRHAKTAAEYAAKHFEEEQVQCVVNLGDIIDGKCSTLSPPEVEGCVIDANDAIDDVLEALSNYKSGRILHTYGNHELYNLSREDLAHKLSIPFTLEPTNDLVGYYDHLLHESQQSSSMKLRFIVLDSYDICLLGRCAETSPKRHAAHRIMAKNNPNFPEEENSPEGLEGLSKRFVGFNGGVDQPQLDWLEQSLQMARDNDEKVILCSHQPIHPDSSYPTCLVWNYDEILTIVRKYNDVVIASFSGHAHKGGYFRDDVSGVHFRTFEAVLESQHPVRTYATVDVWEDRLVVRGWGDCVSDVYDFDHLNTGVENNLTRN
ncbi:hypothetical protein ACHAXR_006544 [Thalassiosira sp. AJA248-18]